MFLLNEKQVNELIVKTIEKIGSKYPKGYKCDSFVKDAYKTIGIDCIFDYCPVLLLEDIFKKQWVGYPCFLKRKKTLYQERRYTHIGIIAPNYSILHYSRRMNDLLSYEVLLTPYEEIFEIYDFAHYELQKTPFK